MKYKSSEKSNDNVIDGAKETWKIPTLMDAIICSFLSIQHNAYRQKSRKFNQHDVLIDAIQTSAAGDRNAKLVIDDSIWNSFDSLRKALHVLPPNKNVTKYESIISTFLCNDEMLACGLQGVIEKVFQQSLSEDLERLRERGSVSRDISLTDLEALPNATRQRARSASSSPERDDLSLSLHSDGLLKRKNSNDGIPVPKIPRFLHGAVQMAPLNLFSSASLADRTLPSISLSTGSALSQEQLFSVRMISNTNLEKVFGDGIIISQAIFITENLRTRLIDKLNDYEWVYHAESLDAARTILKLGTIRVMGSSLVLNNVLPSL